MSTILHDNAAVDAKHYDRLIGSKIRTMRRSLGVTVAQLARASGIPRPSITAIERGGASTRSERHDIAVAVGWLANNRVAKGLTTRTAKGLTTRTAKGLTIRTEDASPEAGLPPLLLI